MNRFVGFATFTIAVFLAIACNSGGEGITINNISGGGSDSSETPSLFKVSGSYDSNLNPASVAARLSDGSEEGEGTVNTVAGTYEITGLTDGTDYDIVLKDSNGNEVGLTHISTSGSSSKALSSSSKIIRSKTFTQYVVNAYTTALVKSARAANQAPLTYLSAVTGGTATAFNALVVDSNDSLKDATITFSATHADVVNLIVKIVMDVFSGTETVSSIDTFLNTNAASISTPNVDALFESAKSDSSVKDLTVVSDASSAQDVAQTLTVVADESSDAVTVLGNGTNIDTPNFANDFSTGLSVQTTKVSTKDSFFTDEDFVGAVGSSAADWTKDWTKTGVGSTSSKYDLDGIPLTSLSTDSDWTTEYTDANGNGTISVHNSSANIKRIKGEFHADLTLDASFEYVLSGVVYIGDKTNSSKITIPAGTTIRGLDEASEKGVLVIRQNAQIIANGTAAEPIVFTSAKLSGAFSQDWGGLIICGKATTNLDSTTGDPEGIPSGAAPYGGSDDTDSSGSLKYVRVEYGGWQINSEVELNGIGFYGVGSGTTVEHVQVHRNSDDGIEFFGGTVNAKYLLVTGCEDDSIDWTEGYRGRIQYAIVQQYPGFGDRGIEADNRGSDNAATPKSHPILSNVTLIGGSDGDTGLMLRAGTEIELYNGIVMNWQDAGLDVDNKTTTPDAGLSIYSVLFANANNYEDDSDGSDKALIELNKNVLRGVSVEGDSVVDVIKESNILDNPYSIDSPSFAISATAPSVTPIDVQNVNSFFSTNTFVGAVGDLDWTSGWTKKGTGSTASTLNLGGVSLTSLSTDADWTTEYTDTNGNGTVAVHKSSANVKRIQGEFHSDLVLDSSFEYVLSGVVYIGDKTNSANITIPAGTTIRGLDESTSKGVLVIRQNAQIYALGTKDAPVVFTSAKLSGAFSQDWGGLIICGKATTNLDSTTGDPEGIPASAAPYGGDDDSDNSGVLRYVRIEYGGWQINSEVELNGIGFYGVGSGTTVEYVQVHRNSDDGIEFFGGTVNAKYLVVTGCEDDSIDWTEGYRGKIQYAVVQQYPGFGDRGIEADNRGSDNSATPKSSPILSNITLIGGVDGDTGLVLRAGTGVSFYNSVVLDWQDAGLDVDNRSTTLASGLTVQGVLFANDANFESDDDGSDESLINTVVNVLTTPDVAASSETSLVVLKNISETAPNYMLADGAPAMTTKTLTDTFFANENFVGAMGATNWASSWMKKGSDPTPSTKGLEDFAITDLVSSSSSWDQNSNEYSGAGTGKVLSSTLDSSANLRLISGAFEGDLALSADYEYILSGVVYIGDGSNSSNITIEAGTVIRGIDEGTSKGTLVIRQNAKIIAEGTASEPIVFTSAKLAGAFSQDWGGLIICGKATTNLNSGTGDPEGIPVGSAPYGGTDDLDNSGVLKYVRVEYGGWQINSETELNGIGFYGVGSGTEVDYVQVHRNSDDGVEFFGGTVNAKHLIVTGCEDDSIDWTEGYRGKIQYAVVQQYAGFGDRGIEADNRGSDNAATPKSSPVLSNITLIGGVDGDSGLVLRAGTGVELYNSIVMNWQDAGLDVDNKDTTPDSGLTIESTLFANASNFENDDDGSDEALITGNNNSLLSGAGTAEFQDEAVVGVGANEHGVSVLVDSSNVDDPNFALASDAPSFPSENLKNVNSLVDAFFTSETFVGAVGTQDWTTGWMKKGTGSTSSKFNLDGIAVTTLAEASTWTEESTDPSGGKIYSTSGGNLKKLTGAFSNDLALDDSSEWILSGVVYIGDGTAASNITIGANTVIRGLDEGSSKGVLVIRQNAQIFAVGTATQPIVFTSAKLSGAFSQDWGGLIICGKATTNLDSATGDPEGIPASAAPYGGTEDADNSGVLKYVRVEYGGWQINSEVELNGIGFYGVGSGTEVDYVQVHRNSDDGIEFFGGTVNAKHLIVTGCEDDSIDWTEGYRGMIQYAVVQQYPGFGDRGIEADNRGSDNSATPKSHPKLSNVTLIGGEDGDSGLVLRAGTEVELYNSIVLNWMDAGLDVDNKKTTPNSGLTIESNLFSNNANFENDSDGSDEGLISGNNNVLK